MTKEKRAGLAFWEKLELSSEQPPAENPSRLPSRLDPVGGQGSRGFSVSRGSRPRGLRRSGRPEPFAWAPERADPVGPGAALLNFASGYAQKGARCGVQAPSCQARPVDAATGPRARGLWPRPRGSPLGPPGVVRPTAALVNTPSVARLHCNPRSPRFSGGEGRGVVT